MNCLSLISDFATLLGTFARDVRERIRKETRSNNINKLIEMHPKFARIVGDTVRAFAVWFVSHWVCYGLTTIMGLLVVAESLERKAPLANKIYFALYLFINLFSFVFPCAAAAYITSTCNCEYTSI